MNHADPIFDRPRRTSNPRLPTIHLVIIVWPFPPTPRSWVSLSGHPKEIDSSKLATLDSLSTPLSSLSFPRAVLVLLSALSSAAKTWTRDRINRTSTSAFGAMRPQNYAI